MEAGISIDAPNRLTGLGKLGMSWERKGGATDWPKGTNSKREVLSWQWQVGNSRGDPSPGESG